MMRAGQSTFDDNPARVRFVPCAGYFLSVRSLKRLALALLRTILGLRSGNDAINKKPFWPWIEMLVLPLRIR